MVTDYTTRKNEVLDSYRTISELVSELQAYAKKINMPDPLAEYSSSTTSSPIYRNIQKMAKVIKEDRFKLFIAGESNCGKSTFINA